MTAPALTVTAIIVVAIGVQALWLRHKLRALTAQVRALRSDIEPAWQWPPRPINGHDHPEPPELIPEPEELA